MHFISLTIICMILYYVFTHFLPIYIISHPINYIIFNNSPQQEIPKCYSGTTYCGISSVFSWRSLLYHIMGDQTPTGTYAY